MFNIICMLLFSMIFCHIVDDFFLQGMCLSNLKQKEWWEKNTSEEKYKYDYLAALFMHCASWAFMIMLPLIVYSKGQLGWIYIMYPINLSIHFFVDDLKANKRKINLIQDQSVHLVQIVITLVLYLVTIK